MSFTKIAKKDLISRIQVLENENRQLKTRLERTNAFKKAVNAPADIMPLFERAQGIVQEYFQDLNMDPGRGTIEINDQRYVLVRASALSKDFLETVQKLYADRGHEQALDIGKKFLFDIGHAIGINDARCFHERMHLKDAVSKLSAGPIHFAFSGWAYVDISAESNLSEDEDFFLKYHHPYSFEADSWLRAGKKSDAAVCIMNAGYSSGWCEESFGFPLTAVEVSCVAKGDDRCTFIMSPPEKIEMHLNHYLETVGKAHTADRSFLIPTFFERKHTEEELERSRLMAENAARLKSDFIANVSHELRTPLNAILGFANLLQKTKLGNRQKQYLDIISHSGNSLLSIVNDVLDLSRIDAGGFTINKGPFHLLRLIDSITGMFENLSIEKKISFQKQASDCDLILYGDPLRLSQVIMNLLGNAFKFTEKGTIKLSLKIKQQDSGSVELELLVADTGIGIPAARIESVFERYRQVESDFTRRQEGAGLGLAITRKLVELQEGTIIVKSKPGKGTVFKIVIPYQLPLEDDISNDTSITKAIAIPAFIKNVLLVEDNVLNQKLIAAIFRPTPCKLTVASNGMKAIKLLEKKQYDLILMDIEMPELNGFQTTHHIRRIMKIDTPVIAMTAHVLAGEQLKCLEAGMNDYLPKPFDEQALVNAMRKLGNKRGGRKKATRTYNQSGSLDLSLVVHQTKNNVILINEMISTLSRELPVLMTQLSNAIEKKIYTDIYKAAHNLRGAISLFGPPGVVVKNLLAIEKKAYENSRFSEIAVLHKKTTLLLTIIREEVSLLSTC